MNVELLKMQLCASLDDIQDDLGDSYKITLVARNTENNDAHIVIGNDDDNMAEVITAINKVMYDGHIIGG